MGRTHFVVIKNADGVVERPMKDWLRENPQYIPEGMTAGTDSGVLRRALKRQGWRLEMRSDKSFFLHGPPNGDTPLSDDDEEEPDNLEAEKVLEAAEEITFGLERDLQSALRGNIDQLEAGLKIIDGGKERFTEAGFIDITAEDAKGNIVVIELKAGTAKPEAVAQVLAYMGAVAEGNKQVRGILVAGDFHKKVVLASHAISNIELKSYSIHFKFDTVE